MALHSICTFSFFLIGKTGITIIPLDNEESELWPYRKFRIMTPSSVSKRHVLPPKMRDWGSTVSLLSPLDFSAWVKGGLAYSGAAATTPPDKVAFSLHFKCNIKKSKRPCYGQWTWLRASIQPHAVAPKAHCRASTSKGACSGKLHSVSGGTDFSLQGKM